jgi:hypothetical protein
MSRRLAFVVAAAFAFFSVLIFTRDASAEEQKQSAEPAPFSVSRMVVAEGVQDREPQKVAETFPASTEKVYCFVEAADISEDTEVSFVWYHGDKEMLKTTLPLKKGHRWRTYAYKNLHGLAGEWKVELQDSTGKEIKSASFKVE